MTERQQTIVGITVLAGLLCGLVAAYVYWGWFGVIGIIVLIAYTVLEGFLNELPGWLKRRKERRRAREGRCIHCGYDLRGNPQATVCSECGRVIQHGKENARVEVEE